MPITLSAVEYLCIHMRDIDRVEIYNMRGHDNPMLLAREVVVHATYGKAAISEHKGRPAGIVGCTPMWPGVWSIWSFGTDDWRRCVVEMSRFGRRVLDPFMRERGAHRVQCESRVDHVEAHRWLQAMGAQPDGLLQSYGRDGSDYIMFSWSDDYVFRKDARAQGRTSSSRP